MVDKSLHQTDPHFPDCYYCYTVMSAGEDSAADSLSPESWSGGAAAGLKSSCRHSTGNCAFALPLAFLPIGRVARSHAACYVDRSELISRLKVILCSDLNFLQIYRFRIISY